jgi:putative salt-induced outer membrane protein YdiY
LQLDRTHSIISRRFDNASHSAAESELTERVNTRNFREPDKACEFGSFAESTDRFNPYGLIELEKLQVIELFAN